MKRILCIWLPHGPSQREALEALAAHCDRFSPAVGVELSAEPDSLLLDITGLAHLFGGEAALAQRIVNDFARRGLNVRVAIADTPGAAWAVVHGIGESADFQETPKPLVSAVRVVPPGETATALRPLPIELLRLTDEVVGLLHQLGIQRIGQLEMLPRGELATRFGPELLRRFDQAVGRLAEPIAARQPSPPLRAHWVFEHPISQRETIGQILEHLIGQMAAMLIDRGRGALRLECRLDCPPKSAVRVDVGLFEPTAAVRHLFELVELQLEGLRMTAPVAAVYVEATVTAPLEYRQQELFADGSARRQPPQLAALVDRLSSRLGERAVGRVRLKSDAQPELAWQYDPLVDRSAGRRVRRQEIASDLPPRPLRLLSRPRRLAATSVLPDGLPVRFRCGDQEHQVAHTWGPERIETGWWRGQIVGRDYFHVETTTGRRFWLYRRLRDQQWFLHGAFE
jgi:protein ImuB